jgi:Zn-dependent M28 family amino/carboxypeptidase
LRGDVSFLASDFLEGRATPSRGLDVAAEYIASQFRAAGLQVQLQTDPARKASNVIGILQGSDPELKKTYVVISSHYDHLGILPEGDEDRIYNGANDDASGVASVIGIARALSKLKPKRSLLFLTFFGEEKGLWGSEYYVDHPVVPLEKTVANLNLEQVGRTDSTEGPLIRKAQVTGFAYSTVGAVLKAAGVQTGVAVVDDHREDTFERSDNYSFARHGIPAHTVGVAWEYPDYHKVSDTWEKLDYTNMARVDDMIAAAVLMIANNPVAPKWLKRLTPREELPEASDQESENSPASPRQRRSKQSPGSKEQ